MMKIAILHVGDLQKLALGGVDQYIKNIIRLRANNEITVLGTCVNGEFVIGQEYHIQSEDLEYKFIPVSDDKYRPLTLGYVKNIKKYASILKLYDVVYAQRIELSIPFWNEKEVRERLVQVVHGSSYYTTKHWGMIKTFLYCFFEKLSIRIAKKTNIVMMRDEFGVPYYKRKYPQYSEKIGYARIPVNTELFQKKGKDVCRRELGLPLDKYIIMYGGRVEDNPKRVLLFPQILKSILKHHFEVFFIVVGNGNDLERLENEFRNNVGENNYRIIGYVDSRELLVKYLNSSDVNINLSEFEGTCTSSLEAIACGCNILSTDVGDVRLFISDGKDGYIIKNDEKTIVEDSVYSIKKMIEGKMEHTNKYKLYECKNVVNNLFLEFNNSILNNRF